MKFLVALLLAASPAFALDRYAQSALTVQGATFCQPITQGEATAVVNISGTWAGLGTFMVATGSPVAVPASLTPVPAWATNISSQTQVQTFSGNGLFLMPVAGLTEVCVQFTTAASGSMGISINLSAASFASAVTTSNTAPISKGGANATVVLMPPVPNFVLQPCNRVRSTQCR